MKKGGRGHGLKPKKGEIFVKVNIFTGEKKFKKNSSTVPKKKGKKGDGGVHTPARSEEERRPR